MSFLFRKASEQFGFNESRYHNLLRTAALFAQTDPVKDLTILRQGWFEELFGCDLSQYVGIGFIVHTLASTSAGGFDETWLQSDPAVQDIIERIPVTLITTIIDSYFTGDLRYFQQYREDFRAAPLRRYTFNPLLDRPVVSGLGQGRLVPVPALIDRKISPLGVWYSGFGRWGEAFATEVGELFEQYIGRHLALIPGARVIPEIHYDNGNRSVDWIVVMQHAVLLIEVKSTRPTDPIRLGSTAMWETLSTKLRKAYTQIEKANRNVSDRHPAFAEIPHDLPRLGLIVTMESFAFVNTPEVQSRLDTESTIPTLVCASQEVELLVTLRSTPIDRFLLDFMTDSEKEVFDLSNELTAQPVDAFCRNEVMDAAWDSYDWGLPPLNEG